MPNTEHRRKRLPREERERLILKEAVSFFAENGFEGQTRALAERLGVTQPLLYRYFPDKEALIARVFDEVYIKKWRPEWENLLRDREKPLEQRLVDFYQSYFKIILKPEFIRIFMFASLKGGSVNELYLSIIKNHVLLPFCEELRASLRLPAGEATDEEIGLAWSLHGMVVQLAMRIWVYNLPAPKDIDARIDICVRSFIRGALELLKERAAASQ